MPGVWCCDDEGRETLPLGVFSHVEDVWLLIVKFVFTEKQDKFEYHMRS